ncbi:MAG: choice-of-anchor tandem repeat GloVer-containing protein [Terriglobales bacterium]
MYSTKPNDVNPGVAVTERAAGGVCVFYSALRRRVAGLGLALAIVLAAAVVVAGPAQAQTYTYNLLYASGGGAGLVMDAQGNLYGTAFYNGCCGNVFKVDTSGNVTVLYAFAGPDGDGPTGSLVLDAQGNLYGTTVGGGAHGNGTVFEVDTDGNETILYSFAGGADGMLPNGGLVRDSQGNLYGTTSKGGNPGCGDSGCGTVFALAPTGNLTVLHSFCPQPNCTDGYFPNGEMTMDAQGNLYGTTPYGGAYCCGTVFKVDASGNETVLHSFGFLPDGKKPNAGLAMDGQGNLYGTTALGGSAAGRQPSAHQGTVFKVDASGNESVLYNFGGSSNVPLSPAAGVIMDAAGNLYGTTYGGGADRWGTVFMLDPGGTLTVLYSFYGKNAGDPAASLVMDAAGNLYGTTDRGAHGGCCGIVFDLLTPGGVTTTTLTSSPDPSTYGQAVTFTVAVRSAVGTPSNGESVSFMKGKTVLGTATLSGGSAAFTTSTLSEGSTSVTAIYAGDPTHSASTSNVAKQVVEKAATTTVLSCSPNPSTNGQAVIFTAVVTSSVGAPPDGDTVTFKEGTAVLGTGSLSGGSASFTTSALPVGTNSIKAVYGGDSNFASSLSNVVKQVVLSSSAARDRAETALRSK